MAIIGLFKTQINWPHTAPSPAAVKQQAQPIISQPPSPDGDTIAKKKIFSLAFRVYFSFITSLTLLHFTVIAVYCLFIFQKYIFIFYLTFIYFIYLLLHLLPLLYFTFLSLLLFELLGFLLLFMVLNIFIFIAIAIVSLLFSALR